MHWYYNLIIQSIVFLYDLMIVYTIIIKAAKDNNFLSEEFVNNTFFDHTIEESADSLV